jgi:uncharacterized protein YndB with AHSA1/START domain
MKITFETIVIASVEDCWAAWTTPIYITKWDFATEDWACPRAEVDLQPGGKFNYRMEAKDGSMGFDVEGAFTVVILHRTSAFSLDDQHTVMVEFPPTTTTENDKATRITESFEAKDTN